MDTPDLKKENINSKVKEVVPTQEIDELEVQQIPQKMPSEAVCSQRTGIPVVMMVIVAVVVALVAFTGALYLGETGTFSLFAPSDSKSAVVKEGPYKDGYDAGLEFAKDKMRQRGFLPLATEVTYLYGATVKSVSGNNITVEFDASFLDFFNEGIVTKTVTVPDAVKIIQNVPKPQDEQQKAYDEFNKEMQLYQKKIESGISVDSSKLPTYPVTFTVKEVSIGELKEGDSLNINADKDISKVDTFEAISVEMFYIPENPVYIVPAVTTIEDTFEDTVVDTVEDTVDDTVDDTIEDTVEDVAEDTVEGTVEGTVEDTVVDTVEDTIEDTVEDLKESAEEADIEIAEDISDATETTPVESVSEEEAETPSE